MPSVHQPDPPGLMHDDPRLLPPLARVVPFVHQFGSIHSPPLGDSPQLGDPVSVGAMSATPPTVLTMVDDPELALSAERIVAAVSARVARAQLPARQGWLAAAAVVVDEAGARRCVEADMPRRDGVALIAPDRSSETAWSAAIDVGAQCVCALPSQESELIRHLAENTESGAAGVHRGRVIAVAAGPGGGGASVFAAALARCAGEALLVDLDPCGGGIDLLLGGESAPGLRWPDLSLQSGRLSWAALKEVLPYQVGLRFLSGTRTFHDIDPGAVGAVVDAGRRGGATVICDVPRQPTPAAVCAVQGADLVVMVTTCDVRGIAATAAGAAVLRTLNPAIGLVVRGPAPGGLNAAEAAGIVEVPLLAAMRPEPMLAARIERDGLRLRRRSPLARGALAVLEIAQRSAGGRAA